MLFTSGTIYLQHVFGFNSLWPSDVIWPHKSGSTLAQVMACYLMAPSHYLNQCWLIISAVLWHSTLSNLTVSAWALIRYNEFHKYTFKITAISPRDQWVNRQAINFNTWTYVFKTSQDPMIRCLIYTEYWNQPLIAEACPLKELKGFRPESVKLLYWLNLWHDNPMHIWDPKLSHHHCPKMSLGA